MVERDLDYEAEIIAEEKDFWENAVLADEEPPYTESGDLVLQSIRNFYGNTDKDTPEVILPPSMITTLEEYETLKTKKSEVDKTSKTLEDKIKRLQAQVEEKLGTSCKAVCKRADDEFIITNNPIFKQKFDNKALKTNHPDIYDRFASNEFSHQLFSVKRKKPKGSAA
jgi:predicted phage-related endonuclease